MLECLKSQGQHIQKLCTKILIQKQQPRLQKKVSTKSTKKMKKRAASEGDEEDEELERVSTVHKDLIGNMWLKYKDSGGSRQDFVLFFSTVWFGHARLDTDALVEAGEGGR